MRLLIAVILTSFLGTGIAAAEEIPSSSRLEQLGLTTLDVTPDEAGEDVRGGAYAVASGTFLVSNGAGFWGPFGFGFAPIGIFGGTTVNVSGASSSGSLAPAPLTPAAAQFGTRHPITQVNNPIFIQNNFTFNGNAGSTSAFATGTVYAAGL